MAVLNIRVALFQHIASVGVGGMVWKTRQRIDLILTICVEYVIAGILLTWKPSLVRKMLSEAI